MIKQVMCIAIHRSDEIYQLSNKFKFWKIIRITSRIYRFLKNWKHKQKLSCPMKAKETEKAKVF